MGTTLGHWKVRVSIGLNSTMQGNCNWLWFFIGNEIVIFVLLSGGIVCGHVVVNIISLAQFSSVWFMATEGCSLSLSLEGCRRAIGLSRRDRMYGVL